MMKVTARSVAYQVLLKVFGESGYTNLVLKQMFAGQSAGSTNVTGQQLDDRDKALCTEIVYGTVQRQRSVDLLLKPYSKRPLAELDVKILTILRMTVYQLSFLDKIPSYAAINEAVELAKAELPKASGFVNGVLRSYLRANATLEQRLAAYEKKSANWADWMGMYHSYPSWLVQTLENQYGRERTERILVSCNQRAHLSIRVNVREGALSEVQEVLGAETGESIVTPSPLSPMGLRLVRGLDVEKLALYQTGKITVQDEGAMLIAPLLQPTSHHRILDMCAAPGTKTTHIAELQSDTGSIEACDIHVHKLKLIRQARDRLHLTSIQTRLADARMLADTPDLQGSFDAVLLDAPCSGFGVLRHRPDIRWKRQKKDVIALRNLQKELLETAVKLVKPGGVIVYATCTILPEENEGVVQAVIDEAEETITWDDIRPELPEVLHPLVVNGRGLTLTPELYDTDGFYMARLKKRAGN